jgi:hypothetical protein
MSMSEHLVTTAPMNLKSYYYLNLPKIYHLMFEIDNNIVHAAI